MKKLASLLLVLALLLSLSSSLLALYGPKLSGEAINAIDLGEGKVDFQTAKGKTAAGVLARAKRLQIPVIAIGGCVEFCDSVLQMGFAGIYPILEERVPLEIAMQRDFAMSNVMKTVARVLSRSSNWASRTS